MTKTQLIVCPQGAHKHDFFHYAVQDFDKRKTECACGYKRDWGVGADPKWFADQNFSTWK